VLAAAAAVKTIEIVAQPSFLENIRLVGSRIMERMSDFATHYRCIGDVRGVGLMIGIEIVDGDGAEDPLLTNELAVRAPGHGLLLRTSRFGRGNVLKIRPPLVISEDEADVLCDRLEQVFAAVAG
jgi:4-aminobutyrate aminotransferase